MDDIEQLLGPIINMLSEETENDELLSEARYSPETRAILNSLKSAKTGLLAVAVVIRHYVKQNQRMIADLQKEIEKLKKGVKENGKTKKIIDDWRKEWVKLNADKLRAAYLKRISRGPAKPF